MATEDNASLVWLPDRIVVLFDWPLRCAPSLYVQPRELIESGKLRIEAITARGFQALIQGALDRKAFAFFADASPTEYKKEADLQRAEWISDRGNEGAV
nr:hypothetical protein [Rhodoferax sp.]